jgi:hypothetical protein
VRSILLFVTLLNGSSESGMKDKGPNLWSGKDAGSRFTGSTSIKAARSLGKALHGDDVALLRVSHRFTPKYMLRKKTNF